MLVRCAIVLCLLITVPLLARDETTEDGKPRSKTEKDFNDHSAVLEKAFRESFLKKLKNPDPKFPPPLPANTSDEDWKRQVIDPAVAELDKDRFFFAKEAQEKEFKEGKFPDELNYKRIKLYMANLRDYNAPLTGVAAMFTSGVSSGKLKKAELEICARLLEKEVRKAEAARAK